MKPVSVLSFGGTFEKVYGNGSGVRDLSFPETSAVTMIVARLGLQGLGVTYERRFALDSLDMKDSDRDWVANWCNSQNSNRCIVIHGTDTMVNTAKVLAEKCSEKVIILTGALQPACMKGSDAEFNFASAIMAARLCPPGVYIVMGGDLFQWDNCRKNPQTGHFEPIRD